MARVRSPARDAAKRLYMESNGEIKLVDIAAKLNVLDTQVRKWKSLDKWEQELKGTLPKDKRNVTNKNKSKNNNKKEPIVDEVKEVLEDTELTDKQRLFCIYYIKYFNATKAAIKAGYSKESAGKIGYQLLEKTRIKSEIDALKKNKLNRVMLSEDDIFQRYMDIAFSDITDYLSFGREHKKCWTKDGNGNDSPVIDPNTGKKKIISYNVVDLKDSDGLDTTVISEVSEGKDGVKIKLQDKMKALQWLSDRLDLIPKLSREKLELEKRKVEQVQEKLDYEKNKNNESDKPIEILIKRKGSD